MKVCRHNEGSGLWFWCPGCKGNHMITVHTPASWKWNGSLEQPTITPSILVHEHKSSPPFKDQPRCHSYVTDGKIRFLADCGHELAGQTVALGEYEQ